jgi:hypothetical protein
LYDLGVRRGDMAFMGIEWLSENLAIAEPQHEAKKRQELVYGAIQFFPASWVDEYGSDVRANYVADSGIEPGKWSCYYYDAFLANAFTFDWMIQTGKDFEESAPFRKNFFE